jgi:hypothetical protein
MSTLIVSTHIPADSIYIIIYVIFYLYFNMKYLNNEIQYILEIQMMEEI